MKTEPNFGTAPKRILLAILVLGLCALMAWSGARYALWQSDRNTFSAHWPLPSGQSARLTTASMAGMPDFVQACEQSTPAVVYIKTTSTQTMRSFNDWFFGDFFQQNPQTVLNSGSGVLISADGYLVTNHHGVDAVRQFTHPLHTRTKSSKRLGLAFTQSARHLDDGVPLHCIAQSL
ncbi:MAG: hypothetical protein RL025_1332 [Bacteroidota bacterium]